MSRWIPAARLALAAAILTVVAPCTFAAPASLDELLEQTRSVRQREAKSNEEREQKFLAERNKQATLTTEARAELT